MTTTTEMLPREVIDEHGLSEPEYQKIVKLLGGRHPNINELGLYSVLWSEHCSYKHSKPLLKKFPTSGSAVLQGPGENAGVIDIGDGLAVSFKIESHNHPSAVEPYQGAATGVGGIIRDVFTMGARPVAGLNSLRFGSITGGNRWNKYLAEGVVAGIAGYGNCIGVPTVGGEIYFDDNYEGNILVNAMCIGIVQSGEHEVDELYGPIITGLADGPGNPVLYVGADTGRDGIHGATFASVELTDESENNRSNVQVGDPFKEKLLLEACLELIKTGVVVGMQDMGAAGLTSSTSEMAARSGTGIELDLDKVPQREEGMTPYEMMLSESQERMVVVVEKGKEQVAYDIFEKWGLHAVQVGKVTDDGMLRCLFQGEVVAEVPAESLADAPIIEVDSERPYYLDEVQNTDINTIDDLKPEDSQRIFTELLGSPTIASKKWAYQQYDHMVQTNTVINPGEGDAAVLRIKGSEKMIAAVTDNNGRYCYLDPYSGGLASVAEAYRNLACVGARGVAVTDCLNFANPDKPDNFWMMEQVTDGLAEACRYFETPVISGNVSMYNESPAGPIYPTPVVGMVGIIERGVKPVGLGFKNNGDVILLLGKNKGELGGSEYLKLIHDMVAGKPPEIDLNQEKILSDAVIEMIGSGLINSAHDISEGGLAVAIAESAIKGNIGADIHIKRDDLRLDELLFSESQARIVVSVSVENLPHVEKIADDNNIEYQAIGNVDLSSFKIFVDGREMISNKIVELIDIYENSIERYLV